MSVGTGPWLLAECESVHAGPRSPVHLRWVDSGASLRTGGFAEVTTLCAARLSRGWGLGLVTDPEKLTRIAPGHPGATCRACLTVLTKTSC